jgi:hypothetical protein
MFHDFSESNQVGLWRQMGQELGDDGRAKKEIFLKGFRSWTAVEVVPNGR